MSLIRYEYPNKNLMYDPGQLFNRTFELLGKWPNRLENPSRIEKSLYPRVDIYDDDDNYYVRFAVPGIKKEDIEVEIENAVLNVKGVYKAKNIEKAFIRSVSVPESVKTDDVEATLDMGILTVRLPKSAHSKPRAITVQ